MTSQQRFFATAPKGMEGLLVDELRQLGAANVGETRAGAGFQGDLATAYRVCLWSRVANRVLLPVAQFPAVDPDALYQGVMSVDWSKHLVAEGTLAVSFSNVHSAITHSQFGAQKVKDAICDQFRHATGVRPSVDREAPDLRVNVFLFRNQATVNIDLSGDSLHRRGYRLEGAAAPLKENLAAAILLRAGWPEIARQGGALVDPLCGSGTLPIEAAMIAADIAPGLQRKYWGFLGWRGHDPERWRALLADALQRREKGLTKLAVIRGFDISGKTLDIAQDNAARLDLAKHIEFIPGTIEDCAPAPDGPPGLVVANPPYGERLGDHETLKPLYKALGDCLKHRYTGWRAAVITGDTELGMALGIRARHINTLYNGALECKLLRLELDSRWYMKGRIERAGEPGAQMFANRLRKNLKQLARWRKQEAINGFRCYDADMPEYAFAVDVYETQRPAQQRWVVVQEYAAPTSVDPRKARVRREQVLAVLPEVFEIPGARVVCKLRERKRGTTQYEKQDSTRRFHELHEGSCRLWINFEDYLDTGLFLDHRLTRRLIGELAIDRTFLNLFAYTGAATVHAGLGGARTTTSVDMSRTYLDWAQRNMALNGLRGRQHQFEQADCLAWIDKALLRGLRFGLIFFDPPTFSNSKRMEQSFDVQRDHVEWLQKTAALLEPDGMLIFSNNFRRFRLDTDALAGLRVENITTRTLPRDFERNPKIHHCWQITRSD
jgi:23S rRNA (guanine2445-N2)-methyltransferase / 23S rRNA (guanine2069-N7)-methyltransferase